MTPNDVTIIKLNPEGQETWRYPGRMLAKDDHSQLVEAYFNHSDLPIHGITLRENDRFVERYYDNRWYNILEAHDREDDHLKGWYCNVSRPARFSDGQIAYVDLALDLLVYPDDQFVVLDEDEFTALALNAETREEALAGLDALIALVQAKSLSAETHY